MLDARCLSAFLLPLSFEAYDYTRLGMRLRKNDPTGNYWYDADGVSPASPVLSDGYSTFTPGISEINGGGSRFYLADAQGNSRGLLDGGQGNTDGYNWDAFGNSVSRSGANPTAYAWNEGAGYQSDADSGLKLLGHRYYDSRTGRFISQDPTGAGGNWYAYCGNSPMNQADPSGLDSTLFTVPGSWTQAQIEAYTAQNYGDGVYNITTNGKVTGTFTVANMLFGSSSAGLALGVTGEFLQGTDNHNRYYGASSTQSRQMKSSTSYFNAVLSQIIDGKKHGSVGTLAAFGYTLLDSLTLDGTEAQLGAYTWKFTDPNNPNAGIDIKNDITLNSLFYHIAEPLGNRPTLEYDSNTGTFDLHPQHYQDPVSGAYGTIHQTLHLNFP